MQEFPEGLSGALLVELEEAERLEKFQGDFILAKARSLAWQAVRSTPASPACAVVCRAWIKQAHTWARRRQYMELSGILGRLEENLQSGLSGLEF